MKTIQQQLKEAAQRRHLTQEVDDDSPEYWRNYWRKDDKRKDDNPDYFRDVRDESDLGDLLDEMMDDKEGADQGMAPSELINHDFIEKQSKRIGLRLDMDKVAEMAELNDDEFVYSGAEIISSAKK